MIPGYNINPVTEIFNVILQDVCRNFFKNLNHCILAFILIVKVFEGNGKNKLAIAVKKNFNGKRVACRLIIGYELLVCFGVFC